MERRIILTYIVHCTWTPGEYGDVPEITIDVLSWSVSEERGVLVKVGVEEVVWGELAAEQLGRKV